MSLVTLCSEHEKLAAEVRDPQSATWRAVAAVSSEQGPKAPVGLLHAYLAQKVNLLRINSSSTLTALDTGEIRFDVLAGKVLNKYMSSLGRGVLYLLRLSRHQLLKYTLDEHQAVVNALARRNHLVQMCEIVKDCIMKPLLDEKANRVRSVKAFLAQWDGDMMSLENTWRGSLSHRRKQARQEERNVNDGEAGKHAPPARQDSAVHIQAE